MADVFNKEPVEFVDLNELFPVLNSRVGLTYEQFRILVENTFWLKNQEEIGVVKAFIVSGSSEFGSLWLSETDGGAPLVPNLEYVYIVQTNGNFKNKIFSWNGSLYEQLAKDSDNNYTNADKSKVDKLITSGNGTKYLSNDGVYKTISGGGGEIPIVVSATDVVVAVADWVADTTYADYGYKADLTLTGILATYEPSVVFGLTEVESGNFASVCLAGENTITIYAKEIPSSSITIPLIKGEEL